ncbi:carboxypeptidase-like regulatory domain-containing protein [uncultured Bacteroides sp.]|uniref:energy transducer TonB n=1 Tax=uncultured Bacteroides sp. TaxID=162156 RepID=UPI0025F47602|nr:carboxypeptidase-like regulatory domain-containing protein [uncultured Bacteroides sp.]
MKLLDYIRGLRKGKEAHRLEKESMKDPFLADAMDGYSQVEGNHEERIEKLRMQIPAHTARNKNSSRKKNSYAITWSIAACLVIGIGISTYFLFLKKSLTDNVFIAKEDIPSAVFEPVTPKEEISSLAEAKMKQDSTHEVIVKQADKKNIVAKSKTTPKPQSVPIAATPVIEEATGEETAGQTIMLEETVVADTNSSRSEAPEMKVAKAAAPNRNLIKGKVTDEKGEPIIGASVAYTGTNTGTITDLNGEFTLKKEESNKELTAQFIGYEPVEIPIDTSRTILIAMNEDKQTLDEVIVVGYGSSKKPTVTGASAKVSSKTKEKYQTPQPVIGKRKYKKYLEENLIRPNDKCKDVKGEVVLAFFVDRAGKPQNITVVHGLCESADKEAVRLVKEGPKWTFGNLPTRVTVHF